VRARVCAVADGLDWTKSLQPVGAVQDRSSPHTSDDLPHPSRALDANQPIEIRTCAGRVIASRAPLRNHLRLLLCVHGEALSRPVTVCAAVALRRRRGILSESAVVQLQKIPKNFQDFMSYQILWSVTNLGKYLENASGTLR
jgi:hypothetical protein